MRRSHVDADVTKIGVWCVVEIENPIIFTPECGSNSGNSIADQERASGIPFCTNCFSLQPWVIGEVDRQRLEIENGFDVLTTALTCEVKSLGHPLAALFVFCTAMLAYNALRMLNAALVAVHGADAVAELSSYSVSLEIAKAADGMNVALTPDDWQKLLPETARGRAAFNRVSDVDAVEGVFSIPESCEHGLFANHRLGAFGTVLVKRLLHFADFDDKIHQVIVLPDHFGNDQSVQWSIHGIVPYGGL